MNLSAMNRATTSVVSLLSPYGQNGGSENGIYSCTIYQHGASRTPMVSPKLQMEDELDNWSDEVESHQTVAKPVKNGQKNRLKLESHFLTSGNEDGSLPSSPDSPSDCVKLADYPVGYNRLDCETRELLGHFFRIYTGLSQPGRSRSKALSTLTRVVNDVIGKHQIAYNGMIQKLSLDQREDDMSFVTTVAENLFSDGTTNWGRVASLVAFGAMICKRLKENGRDRCVDTVADQISSYLLANKQDWLLSNKGWDGFVEFFHVEDPESVVRNALMAFAGVAGIGAGLAFLIR
ncbi:hypothetical protein ANANG_G00180970 [Anguilla anguilla]|uniref:Bcl-2 Bcl-2 homology region 1-3 domain-containing protein n=1 Tax=Anguilla anguilla TaxID=7936 RepID=A0A9D3RTD2_ANGAN|nr:hypothetical protein ANANG_G00180970 [Anguilla anguilla]